MLELYDRRGFTLLLSVPGASLRGAALAKAELTDVKLVEMDLTGADLRAATRRLYAHRGKTRRRLSEGIAKRGKDTGGQRVIGAPPDRKNLRSTPPLQCGLLVSSATSIPRRQAIVNDDMLLLHVDVAAGGEVLQYPRHHLARGADTVGNVLLRELALDHEAIALRRSHAVQVLLNTAVDVEQRQALHVVGEGAHAVREVFDEAHGDVGVLGEHVFEDLFRQHAEAAALQGHHRGRTRRVVEQRELAEIFSRALLVEHDLLALLVGEIHLHLAFLDHVKRIAVIALVDEDGVLGITAYHGVTGDLGDLGLVQTGNEGNVF